MSDKLTTASRELNEITLKELSNMMDKYGIRRADVARIIGVSRSLVTRWYRHDKRCPTGVPAAIRAAFEIPSGSTTAEILKRYKSTEAQGSQ